jgi:hypothetical protein
MPTSQKLVQLIETNADELTRQWLRLVRNDPQTATYHTFDEKTLYDRVYNVYSQLGKWISRESRPEDIAVAYTNLGDKRREEGFLLSEVIQALILSRRVLWSKIQEDGFLDTALDLHMAQALRNHVAQFFDRATYFIIVGYEKGYSRVESKVDSTVRRGPWPE